MPKFSEMSKQQLHSCDPQLQLLFNAVIIRIDCSIICGYRDRINQNNAYYSVPQRSTVLYPNSKHNTFPCTAVDVAPYPIDWDDVGSFYMFVGYVKAVADSLTIQIRCGADWNMDGKTKDQKFNDLVHFELVNQNPLLI